MRLKAENIWFRYTKEGPWILSNIDFSVAAGERIGIVGPSGCGKSTLSKILAGYEKPASGTVLLDGAEIPAKGYAPVQMIFQHPELAVNPRLRMKDTLFEAWHPGEEFLSRMGIKKEWLTRWPSELSGGELQRFCIARVLAPETRFLICDEITTMLDVINQQQIWRLLLEIAAERELGMVIVTHNGELAKKVCTKIIIFEELNHGR